MRSRKKNWQLRFSGTTERKSGSAPTPAPEKKCRYRRLRLRLQHHCTGENVPASALGPLSENCARFRHRLRIRESIGLRLRKNVPAPAFRLRLRIPERTHQYGMDAAITPAYIFFKLAITYISFNAHIHIQSWVENMSPVWTTPRPSCHCHINISRKYNCWPHQQRTRL